MERRHRNSTYIDRQSVTRTKRFQYKEAWPPHWRCELCYYDNRHFRTKCNRCDKSKSLCILNHGMQGDSVLNNKEHSDTNWTCTSPNCKYVNNGHAKSCHKCGNCKQSYQENNYNRNVIKYEASANKEDGPFENTLEKYGLPTSFGATSIKLENGESGSQKKDLSLLPMNDRSNNPMSSFGLPNGFGCSDRHVVGHAGDQGEQWECSNCYKCNGRLDRSCLNCNYPKSCIEPGRNLEGNLGNNDDKREDWMCYSCSKTDKGFPNKHFRYTCTRCKASRTLDFLPKPRSPAKADWMDKYEEDVKYFQDQYNEGDWYCIPCGNLANGHQLSICYKCKQPRTNSDLEKNCDEFEANKYWACFQCKNRMNFRKICCDQCGWNRANNEQFEGRTGIPKQELEKDWWCTKCKSSNLYDRDTCFRCRSWRSGMNNQVQTTADHNVSTEYTPTVDPTKFVSSIPPPPIMTGRKVWLDKALECMPENSKEQSVPNLRKRNPPYSENSNEKDRVVNKTTTINPDLFLQTSFKPQDKKPINVRKQPKLIDNCRNEFEYLENVGERVSKKQTLVILPNIENRRKRTSTPADSNCSPFSITPAKFSPFCDQSSRTPRDNRCENTPSTSKINSPSIHENSIIYTKTSYENYHKSKRKLHDMDYRNTETKSIKSNGAPLPALQGAKDRPGQHRKRHSKNLTRPLKKKESLITGVKKLPDTTDIPSDSSSVLECNQDIDWHRVYDERKRQADAEKKKEIESQQDVRGRLAALAGGYLTSDGKSTGKYVKQAASENESNLSPEVEVVVLDEDEDDIVALPSDSSINSSVQIPDNSKHESGAEESNELKRVLRSNMPDNEKASILATFGITMKASSESVQENTEKDKRLWLVDKVNEADKALNRDKNTLTDNKNNDLEIITLD